MGEILFSNNSEQMLMENETSGTVSSIPSWTGNFLWIAPVLPWTTAENRFLTLSSQPSQWRATNRNRNSLLSNPFPHSKQHCLEFHGSSPLPAKHRLQAHCRTALSERQNQTGLINRDKLELKNKEGHGSSWWTADMYTRESLPGLVQLKNHVWKDEVHVSRNFCHI